MKSINLVCAAAMMCGVVAAPLSAQMASDAMSSGSMKMSMKDKKMMTKCQGMSHGMMMKNAGCKKMTKMHPDMMKGG